MLCFLILSANTEMIMYLEKGSLVCLQTHLLINKVFAKMEKKWIYITFTIFKNMVCIIFYVLGINIAIVRRNNR